MTKEGHRLDPCDWEDFSKEFHGLLDACLERMREARQRPWQPKPDNMAETVCLDDAPLDLDKVFEKLTKDIMPYATGGTHPRFFGWVQGTGLPVSVAADLIASTMNSNCGGRDHGATKVEEAVINWIKNIAGFPESASGILTTGTSQATIIALSVARFKRFGSIIRQKGVAAIPQIRVYAAKGVHSCLGKALEVMGHGREALKLVEINEQGQMDLEKLKTALLEDEKQGIEPLAIVATAGSVNLGLYDPIEDLATLCERKNIWLHIDGAFGFWSRLADEPWRSLSHGIERASSIACDFHKWMFVPYDCGACLIREREIHKQTFSERPTYLAPQQAGLGGGDLWYCDYGIELSRGFRALKVWAALRFYGKKALGDVITDNCKQAAYMGKLVEASPHLTLAFPVISNVCCFKSNNGKAEDIAACLQLSGDVVFSTTIINNESCLRAAIVNHRTTREDIVQAIKALERCVI